MKCACASKDARVCWAETHPDDPVIMTDDFRCSCACHATPKAPPKPKRGRGQPKKKLTEEQIQQLRGMASVGATQIEMAWALGLDVKTLMARIRENTSLEAALKAAQATTRLSVRRMQLRVALNENHPQQMTALIWCGKTLLGQSERVHVKIETVEDARAELMDLFPELGEGGVKALLGESIEVEAKAVE